MASFIVHRHMVPVNFLDACLSATLSSVLLKASGVAQFDQHKTIVGRDRTMNIIN